MRTVPVASCVIALATLVGGCNVYDSSLLGGSTGPDRLGCGTGGSAEPPARPTNADNGPDAGVDELVFGLKDVVIDTSQLDGNNNPLWTTTGFNLDERCTTVENNFTSCNPPGANTIFGLDGVQGIDNTFGPRLFPLVDLQYQIGLPASPPAPAPYAVNLQDYCTRVQEEGHSVLLIRIRGWNGMGNDPHVQVDVSQSVFGAPGTSTTPPGVDVATGNLSGTSTPAMPSWTGNDWFWARDDNFIGGDLTQPKVFDDNAYIADWVLVMRIPDRSPLVFVGPTLGLTVTLTDTVAMGNISPNLQRLNNVFIGGRWSKVDLLATASSVNVCPGTPLYTTVASAIDNMADVRSNPSDDGMDLPCDAVSMGVEFSGYRAHIAGLAPAPNSPSPCP